LRGDPSYGPIPGDVLNLVGGRTALVTFSHVSYRSAHIADMAQISEIAHGAGALALWDLSHSAGSVPVALNADGADLAVGCTYKYLNGGSGAPAFMYARADLQDQLSQPIWGWPGRRNPFEMDHGYDPAHVALAHPDAKRLCADLIDVGVIPDFRRPDVIRFGLSPLTTRFVDVWDGVEALRTLLSR